MKLILSLATAAVFALGLQAKPSAKPAAPKKPAAPSFKDIQPIFNMNCIGCHGGERPRAGIDLTSYEGIIRGSDEGPIVKKGAPKHSLLIEALRGMPGVRAMPPRRDPLPEAKIKQIENWIKSGAKP